jgi:hypothetical protein
MPPFTPEQYLNAAEWLDRCHKAYAAVSTMPWSDSTSRKFEKISKMLRQAGGETDLLGAPASAADGLPEVADIIHRWNARVKDTKIPAVRSKPSPQLAKKIRLRLKEHRGNVAVFDCVFAFVVADPFYSGQDGKWIVDLHWLVKSPDQFQRMLDKALAAGGSRPSNVFVANCEHEPRCTDGAAACTRRTLTQSRIAR